ncbi:major facilitator superfamily transporter [Mytilinidion resinicola]|uniref:Major facilitator superfamily transporter n=1 Tax=Mytilinidion resinicola TaxID=574789 RepID=A0A6A6YAB6_9PEZI|nr:major facilitator superfamily transporter [Mytilinidion resinicola]KAF2805756.1 major facilitator superfamily transporter [Mytilinidion resinicola]
MTILRDAGLGQFIHYASGGKYFKHPEESPNFDTSFLREVTDSESAKHEALDSRPISRDGAASALDVDLEKSPTANRTATRSKDGTLLVGWYSEDDVENPLNWSPLKKYSVALIICLYTVSVYLGAAIFSSSQPGVMEDFGVSLIASSLGMALYILAYGIGPMIFSPLSEIPAIGRTTPYLITFFIHVILLIPTSLVDNFAGLLVLRFLLGFFGSPCLATSGASFQDIFPGEQMTYIIGIWAAITSCGPSLGPLLATFSIEHFDWHWSQWEMLMLSGPVLILMVAALPETSAATILLRRARRLRAATGNPAIKSQSEIDQSHLSISSVTFNALVKPWEINILDPAMLFTTFYTGLLYGIFYTFFEAFPLVYEGVYHFSAGGLSLAFLSVFVAQVTIAPSYLLHWRYVVHPGIKKNGIKQLEDFLKPALVSCFALPIGLFIFAWTSRASVHWIVSMLGVSITGCGMYVTLQVIFIYVPLSYPKYAASLFAANALARSLFAFAAILYATPMFEKLGIDGGVSLLAGCTVLCCGGMWVLYYCGPWLRARSRFAVG